MGAAAPRQRCPALGLTLALALSGSLLGCATPRDLNRIVVARKARVDSVDPVQAVSLGAIQLLAALGDPLYRLGPDGTLTPVLAAAAPRLSADGLQATVRLREGLRFHDGTPLDAAALVFSLERFMAIGRLSYLLRDRVAALEVIAPLEMRLTLKAPYSPLPELLSSTLLTPVSPTAYRDHADRPLNTRFVGTGPYRLAAFDPQRQRLEPWQDYPGPPPANRGLDLISFSNSTALFGALLSDEVDVLLSSSLESDQQRALHQRAGQGGLKEAVGPALGITYLALRTDQPPLDRPELRRALALSVARRPVNARVSHGLNRPWRSVVPPSIGGSLAGAWPAYDPEQARRLLRQSGYCQGERLQLPLTFRSNSANDRLFALTWQAQIARDLGDCINLETSGVESTTAYRQLGDGAFPMIMLDWKPDFPDADSYLSPLLSCRESEGERCLAGESASGGSFWTRPGLQEQLVRSQEIRGEARTRVLEDIQREAAGGVPVIPIWLEAIRVWGQPRVGGLQFDGTGLLRLARLSTEGR
ncbi:ABC transporter substrate-binding protein [Synechococcus sp. RSCCF101]|nr:ABC transporter substrate-binding protein [Synechococcus sp. RSCCF101]